MREIIDGLQNRLEAELLSIEKKANTLSEQAERSVTAVQQSLQELRQFITGYTFTGESEEILFFKEIKPVIYSKLIYFLRVYHIETRRPKGCKELQRELLQAELKKIKDFYNENLWFYQYYHSGATYLDREYFLRGKADLRLSPDEYSMLIDPQFSTAHSYKIAAILAYELLQPYLLDALDSLDRKEENIIKPATQGGSRPALTWQATKVALAELCYAIYSYGAVPANDIRKVSDVLAQAFNTPLDNVYKMYEEIRLRKKNRTPFLSALIQSLNRKMDEDDEHAL